MINQILQADPKGSEELTQATLVLNKVLDEILVQPIGPKRWRAVVDVLAKTNPIAGEDSKGRPISFRVVNRECIAINKLARTSASDKFGRSADNQKSNYRGYLSMPRIVKTVIEVVDPGAFKTEANAKKMFNTLKEYTTAEKY